MGGIKDDGLAKFQTGAIQGSIVPGDDQDLDAMAIRVANGEEGDSVGGGGPELPFGQPTAVEGLGINASELALLTAVFPGAELVDES